MHTYDLLFMLQYCTLLLRLPRGKQVERKHCPYLLNKTAIVVEAKSVSIEITCVTPRSTQCRIPYTIIERYYVGPIHFYYFSTLR